MTEPSEDLKKGRCYELAGKFYLEQQGKGCTLVHGTVYAPQLGYRIDHAWVELHAGETITDDSGDSETLEAPAIYDQTIDEQFHLSPKRWYHRNTMAEETARYDSVLDVLIQIDRHGTWGGWPPLDSPGNSDIVAVEAERTPTPEREGEPP